MQVVAERCCAASCNNYCLLCALPPLSAITFHDEDVHAILLSTT